MYRPNMRHWGEEEHVGAPDQPAQDVAPAKGPTRLRRFWRTLGLFGVAALVLLVAFDTFRAGQAPVTPGAVATEVAQALASATPPPSFASQVYQQVRPSVVLIQRFTDKSATEPDGEGSGVVVDQSGLILTALHVVADAGRLEVTFFDGSTAAATIMSQEPQNDIAVLQVAQLPPTVPPAVMGDPSSLQVGDEAIVIGNPFGLVGSLSAGAISGLDRTFVISDTGRTLDNLIQFDAPVNPGNSGGPLLNRGGEVVGIVTSLLNPTKDNVFIGIGFAVPITTASSGLGESPF
jgi:S1-C subfamily serine protease